MKTKLTSFVATLAVSLLSLSAVTHAAGTASFSLSPAAATETHGSNFTVSVFENGNGSPVNVVTANLSYDTSKLQFVSDACAGAFSNSVGNGTASLNCYTTPGATAPTDNELVGTVTFEAIAGSGSTAVSFASSSIIASNGTNVWNGATAAGTYTLTTPSSGGGTTTGGGSTSTGTSSGSSPNKPSSTTKSDTTTSSTGTTLGANTTQTTTSSSTTPQTTQTKSSAKSTSNPASTAHTKLVASATRGTYSAAGYWIIASALAIIAGIMYLLRSQIQNSYKAAYKKYSVIHNK